MTLTRLDQHPADLLALAALARAAGDHRWCAWLELAEDALGRGAVWWWRPRALA